MKWKKMHETEVQDNAGNFVGKAKYSIFFYGRRR